MNKPLTNSQDLLQPGIEMLDGYFRITGRVAFFDPLGRPRIRIRLSDYSGDLVGVIDPVSIDMCQGQSYLTAVYVQGWRPPSANQDSEAMYNLNRFRDASTTELQSLPPLQTLPKRLCHDVQMFRKLVDLVSGLSDERLRHFVRLVLEQVSVAEVFMNVPASERYHHCEPGGLLRHSLEVAQAVDTFIGLFEPDMPVIQRELGIVAGLLHDVGKVLVFDREGRRTPVSQLVEHDDLTLELCAQALLWLDRELPDGALALRHIWSAASPGARYGIKPMMTLAKYVRDADGQSALADNERRAFRSSTKIGFCRRGRNHHWRANLLRGGENRSPFRVGGH